MKAEDYDDFEELLEQAELNAKNNYEMGFCSDMRDKYDGYKEETFISEKQYDLLFKIANGK